MKMNPHNKHAQNVVAIREEAHGYGRASYMEENSLNKLGDGVLDQELVSISRMIFGLPQVKKLFYNKTLLSSIQETLLMLITHRIYMPWDLILTVLLRSVLFKLLFPGQCIKTTSTGHTQQRGPTQSKQGIWSYKRWTPLYLWVPLVQMVSTKNVGNIYGRSSSRETQALPLEVMPQCNSYQGKPL